VGGLTEFPPVPCGGLIEFPSETLPGRSLAETLWGRFPGDDVGRNIPAVRVLSRWVP
jgi:hypothetical protein